MAKRGEGLGLFHAAVAEWFRGAFAGPTPPQAQGWPAIARGDSTLILAPTGSGKTLTAFLWCINRLMFEPVPPPAQRCRVLYVSPLKALAVDIERNLRSPLAGIANRAAARGDTFHLPAVTIRTGDTPAAERARFQRQPADILITTPESLYLLLTSNARESLRSIDTVIIDEIHALVPTKRGAHMALSLERLEELVRRQPNAADSGAGLQRIGLSATQRPLDEVARYLGGAARRPTVRTAKVASRATKPSAPDAAIEHEFAADRASSTYRPVTIVDASAKKRLDLRIEVPVEDMARLGQPLEVPSGPASQPVRHSIWTAIHPRLLELVLAHQSTLIFVNSRRIAERLAAAVNELAGETLVRSHHGSLARPQRIEVEDRLEAGLLRGLVATSSLELGIDMGAIDLVIQIEAPPSVASGLQRIGRAGHTIDAASRGIIVPKFRGDLVACAAVTRAMHDGKIESSRYPRNPLDVLAQQIVAMSAMEAWDVDAMFDAVRRAAPYADLSRAMFEGVLDMLSGRYPSDDFADLRARLTWDRLAHTLTAREGAKRMAVARGRVPPRRHRARMVRPGRFAVGAPPVPREAAQAGRARRAGRARPAGDRLAGGRPPTLRTRRAARCDREPSGRAAACVNRRNRHPRREDRPLQPGRPRRADRRWGGRLVRARAARRARRASRPVPGGSLFPPAAHGRRRRTRRPRARHCRASPFARRVVLRRPPRRRRRGVSGRNGGRHLGPRVARPDHQRHLPPAPRGDTIFRAARTLHRALAGHPVVRFTSVFPALAQGGIEGRRIEAVRSAGKHPLVEFPGDIILRTHMRLHGSWHLYKSEALFVCRVNPYTKAGELDDAVHLALVTTARHFLTINTSDSLGAQTT